MSLSPTCTVNNGSVPASVGAGASVEIELTTPAGVQFWGLGAIACDDSTNLATVQASLSINQTTKKATFTAPGTLGSAVIFMSTVGIASTSALGAGRDVNGALQPTWTTTFKAQVLTSNGLAVVVLNEIYEGNATVGWVAELNAAIRAASGSSNLVPSFNRLSANTTLLSSTRGQIVLADTSSAPWTLKLPTGGNAQDADEWTIVDSKAAWALNPLTLTTDVGTVPIVDPLGIASSGDTQTSLSLASKRASLRVKYAKSPENIYLVV